MVELLEAINQYYHQHGRYPKVKVSPKFYHENLIDFYGLVWVNAPEIDESVDEWEFIEPDDE